MHIRLIVHASRVAKNTNIGGNARTIAHMCVSGMLGGAGDSKRGAGGWQ